VALHERARHCGQLAMRVADGDSHLFPLLVGASSIGTGRC
jgi:hypothetical protein